MNYEQRKSTQMNSCQQKDLALYKSSRQVIEGVIILIIFKAMLFLFQCFLVIIKQLLFAKTFIDTPDYFGSKNLVILHPNSVPNSLSAKLNIH